MTLLRSIREPKLVAGRLCLFVARPPPRRLYASRGGGNSKKPSSPLPSTARAQRILDRLPSSLQKYTRRLKGAPVSHVVAFLVLHELTAIVPLLGLFGLFHYAGSEHVATYMTEHYGVQVSEGVRRFERYFRRKGWLGEDTSAATHRQPASGGDNSIQSADGPLVDWTSGTYRIVAEVGLAYAITKVLLPVRIVVSLWATPWFAGILGRASRIRQWARGKK